MSKSKCEAKDPATCPYHRDVLLMESASSFDEYYHARRRVERWEDRGGDDFISRTGDFVKFFGTVPEDIRSVVNRVGLDLFTELADYHQSEYGRAVVRAEDTESILDKVLRKNDFATKYDEGSHAVGADIYINDPVAGGDELGYGLSVKSGSVSARGVFKFSGSRSTSFPTLEEKLVMLKASKPDAYTALAVKHGNGFKKNVSPWINYNFLMFKGDVINFGSASDWVETDKGWSLVNPSGAVKSLHISRKMSDQLWLELNTLSPDFHAACLDIRVNRRVKKD